VASVRWLKAAATDVGAFKPTAADTPSVPERVATTDPEGVDFGWVMQVTFVVTIVVGSPIVALLSVGTTLDTWTARVLFAVRVGSVVWFVTAIAVYLYARRAESDDLGVGES